MLEKFSFFDAHFHSFSCFSAGNSEIDSSICGVSSCHSKEDLEGPAFLKTYGIHPLDVKNVNADEELIFMEKLLLKKSIAGVGECGFDFFTAKGKETSELQDEIFRKQLELALIYNVPLVIHCRKANEKIFKYSNELKKLPSVLFHSFMGIPSEGKSLLKHGINAYFSFGKQIFNGNKKVISCVCELPLERLLLETDAPFQALKGEERTYPSEIKKIYNGAYELINTYRTKKNDRLSSISFEEFTGQLQTNFTDCFCSY